MSDSSRAQHKYAAKFHPPTIGAKFEATKALAIQYHNDSIPSLFELKKKVYAALQNEVINSNELLSYFYFGESALKLSERFSGETLKLEAAILRFDWTKRGLDEDLLDRVLFLVGINPSLLVVFGGGAGILPQPLVNGTLTADGSEQLVASLSGLNRLMGYISLKNMAGGDTVIIREYMIIGVGGPYEEYHEITYSDVQSEPLVYIKTKPIQFNAKITLQQTAGGFRNFEYDFMKEA